MSSDMHPLSAALVAARDRGWDRATAADWSGVLASLPLFSRLGKRPLRKLAGLAQFRHFADGDLVVRIGDPGDAFYVILGGKAKVVGKRGRMIGIGDYFGEMSLLDGEPRSATITAERELQTMLLPRREFLELLEREPQISLAMLAELSSRVRRLEKSLTI